MDTVMGLAMLFGIAPALVLMFLGVRNYTFPKVEQPFFSDPTFFMLFVVGMVEGSIMFMVLRIFNAPNSVILMALIAVIQTMAMVVVMNLKRFRGMSDSIFYGFALGLGSACGLGTGFCYIIYGTLSNSDMAVDPSIVSLLLMTVAMALILGACGTTIGEGIARHQVMEFTLQAMIPAVAFYMLLSGAVTNSDSGIYYLFLVLMLAVGGAYYYFMMKKRLPSIVREVLRMEGKKRSDIPKN